MAQRLLNQGAVGQDVRQLQGGLNAKATYAAQDGNNILAKLVVDGIFGPKTRAKVVEFQKRSKLVADGIAGPKTVGAIFLPNMTTAVQQPPMPVPNKLPPELRGNQVVVTAIATAIAKGVKLPAARPPGAVPRPAPPPPTNTGLGPNVPLEVIFNPAQAASLNLPVQLGNGDLLLRNAFIRFPGTTAEYPVMVTVTANGIIVQQSW